MIEHGYQEAAAPKNIVLPKFDMFGLTTQEEYLHLVGNAVKEIKKHRFTKVVLSRRKFLPLSSSEVKNIATNGVNDVSGKFCYKAYNAENEAFWLGATPEVLLQYHKGNYTSYALAGTAHNTAGFTEKEYEEQAIVARYLKHQLQGSVIHESPVNKVDVKGMYHLKSELTWPGTLEKYHSFLKQIHPTPAVCGVPVTAAKAFIATSESTPRALYTGYIGFKNHEQAVIMVNLRCGRLYQNGILLFAGGGITEESDPEKEFLETELKFEAIIRDLNL